MRCWRHVFLIQCHESKPCGSSGILPSFDPYRGAEMNFTVTICSGSGHGGRNRQIKASPDIIPTTVARYGGAGLDIKSIKANHNLQNCAENDQKFTKRVTIYSEGFDTLEMMLFLSQFSGSKCKKFLLVSISLANESPQFSSLSRLM